MSFTEARSILLLVCAGTVGCNAVDNVMRNEKGAHKATGVVTDAKVIKGLSSWTADDGLQVPLSLDESYCHVSYRVLDFGQVRNAAVLLQEEPSYGKSGVRSKVLPEPECQLMREHQRIAIIYEIRGDRVLVVSIGRVSN